MSNSSRLDAYEALILEILREALKSYGSRSLMLDDMTQFLNSAPEVVSRFLSTYQDPVVTTLLGLEGPPLPCYIQGEEEDTFDHSMSLSMGRELSVYLSGARDPDLQLLDCLGEDRSSSFLDGYFAEFFATRFGVIPYRDSDQSQ